MPFLPLLIIWFCLVGDHQTVVKLFKLLCIHVKVCEGERERERDGVCVCVCDGVLEDVCMCLYVLVIEYSSFECVLSKKF